MNETLRIPIRLANKRAFVWDVDGTISNIMKLRSIHRICGILGGTLPHLSQQNVFLGIPLLLSPEEVVLLVEKEIAVLVDDPSAYPQPSTLQFQQWLKEQQDHLKQQIAVEVKNTKDNGSQDHAMSDEAVRKRKERELKRQQKAAEMQQQQGDTQVQSIAFISAEEDLQPQSQSTATSTTVLIPTASSSLPWHLPQNHTYDSVESAKAAGIWDFPSDLHDSARYRVFKDLWEQGYFLGGGIKFGGDYLVYPGDPLRYHSHFAATVIESPTAVLRPMEIVAHGRLGTATKKTHLLCCWDDAKKRVRYISIEWAGFG